MSFRLAAAQRRRTSGHTSASCCAGEKNNGIVNIMNGVQAGVMAEIERASADSPSGCYRESLHTAFRKMSVGALRES